MCIAEENVRRGELSGDTLAMLKQEKESIIPIGLILGGELERDRD